MGHFIITFRIKAGPDYQKRYDSLIEKIADISIGNCWDETSAFYAIEAFGTAETICDELFFTTDISPEDKLLVIDVTNRTKSARGDLGQVDLLGACLGF